MKLCRNGVSPLANGAPLLEGHRRGGQEMRIVIVGQHAFGKAVLDDFIARGNEVSGVIGGARDSIRPASNTSVTVSFCECVKFKERIRGEASLVVAA